MLRTNAPEALSQGLVTACGWLTRWRLPIRHTTQWCWDAVKRNGWKVPELGPERNYLEPERERGARFDAAPLKTTCVSRRCLGRLMGKGPTSNGSPDAKQVTLHLRAERFLSVLATPQASHCIVAQISMLRDPESSFNAALTGAGTSAASLSLPNHATLRFVWLFPSAASALA